MEAVLESQVQLQNLFMRKMEEFQDVLQKSPSTQSTSDLAKEFTSFRAFIMTALKALQSQIQVLACQFDIQEMRSRHKMVLFHGVPEVSKEDTAGVVVKTVVGDLKVTEFSAADISRCHRMGRQSSTDRPRPILVKVRDLALRNKLWHAKTSLKGSGITLSEFLTKPRHEAFMAARERFGITKCWTREGFIFMLGHDGTRHRVSSVSELDKITQSQVPPITSKAAAKTAAKETVAAPKSRRAATAAKK